MEKWSISFWMILPLNLHKTSKKHVLIQSIKGTGAYIEINEACTQLQAVCEESNRVVNAGIELRKVKKGWHNIVVVCNNLHPNCEGAIKFFLDGKQTHDEQPCICI